MAENEENPNEGAARSVQIMFKMPLGFMERFDRVAETFGYSRTEAVREAMRRFQLDLEENLSDRPEEAVKGMQTFVEGLMGSLMKLGEQAQKPARNEPAIVPVPRQSATR